jgi:tetratricopeptide (TPR) repeat protein
MRTSRNGLVKTSKNSAEYLVDSGKLRTPHSRAALARQLRIPHSAIASFHWPFRERFGRWGLALTWAGGVAFSRPRRERDGEADMGNAQTIGRFLPALLVPLCVGLVVASTRAIESRRAFRRALSEASASDERMAALDRALSLNPGHGEARAARAREWLIRGRGAEAMRDATQAARSFGSVDATARQAAIMRRLGRDDEALERLETASRMWPDSPEILAQLAALHCMSGRFDEGRAVAEELNARAPDNVDALYLLGVCAQNENANARARAWYRQMMDRLSLGARPVAVTIDEPAVERFLKAHGGDE